ncbi:MAG: hypothetical protein JJ902_04000 [Roseibium sp.]|nr:hypothetical protein [Roseibium sp.]
MIKGTYTSSQSSNWIPAKGARLGISGTWTGSVKLQARLDGEEFDAETFTDNGFRTIDLPAETEIRIEYTHTSGSMTFRLG